MTIRTFLRTFRKQWFPLPKRARKKQILGLLALFSLVCYFLQILVKLYSFHCGFVDVSQFIKYYFFLAIPINDDQEEILATQRKMIAEEMEGFNTAVGGNESAASSLAAMVPELGGQPIRVLILSSWRTGSTFLGSIINSHPGVFYHFEPLMPFRTQIRDDKIAETALGSVRSLLLCEYHKIKSYQKRSLGDVRFLSLNTRLWHHCQRHPRPCSDPGFMSRMCRLFPVQSGKLVRLRLRYAERLLEDPSLNVKVIHLVRDPRGVVRSRWRLVHWCRKNPDCTSPELICWDQRMDFQPAVELTAKYPDRFTVVRYEDLCLRPHEYTRKILAFLGLQYHKSVQEYLDTHTTSYMGDSNLSTNRDSRKTPFVWQQDMPFQEVQEIQKTCEAAMKHWGYRFAHNATHQRTFNPLGPFPLGKNLNIVPNA